jgi:hypothetical protein
MERAEDMNEQISKDLTPGGVQLRPEEKIGAARFAAGMQADSGVTITNKLPEGENPAGWFILGDKYVDCNGLTPEERAKQDPSYFKQKAAEALAQAEATNDKYEQQALRMESMQLELSAAQDEARLHKERADAAEAVAAAANKPPDQAGSLQPPAAAAVAQKDKEGK